jgi:hypothetical protein
MKKQTNNNKRTRTNNKYTINRTGKACTMDSGFCVLKVIVELEAKLGVFGQALLKSVDGTGQRVSLGI